MSNQKFRLWDSAALAEAAKLGIQLKQKIEEISIDTGSMPSDLPDSLIPTDKLYMLALAYTAAYDKLIEYDLLKTGNIKHTNNTH